MLDFGFYNMDCMDGMKEFPDNYFDLAIVDPPYGSGLGDGGDSRGWFDKYRPENLGGGREYWNRFGERFQRYINPQTRQRGSMEFAEPAGHGRQNSQKNHNVGRCPETGIL